MNLFFEGKNAVIGAGLCGSAIARLIAEELKEPVIVFEKKEYAGGNCFDFKNDENIFVHKYGSHIFHTNNKNVWDFVKRFSDFNNYKHKVYAYIDGKEVIIPFNLTSLFETFPLEFAKKLEEKLLSKFELNSKVSILDFQNQNDDDLKKLSDFITKC